MTFITEQTIDRFRQWLVSEERQSGTIEKYLRDVRELMVYLNGAEIIKEGVSAWKEYLLTEKGLLPVTINSKIAAVDTYCRFAGIDYRVKYLKVQKRLFNAEKKNLGKDEYLRLIDTAKQAGKIRIALIMETIGATGIRVSELKYITVDAIRNGAARVHLKGKVRTILLPGVVTPLSETDTTYVAEWEPARFISFNKNSGTGAMAKLPALGTENYTATIPENGFTRDVYAFTGWNTKSTGRGTAYRPGDSVTLTANITLYAQWTSAYTVFLDPNGGEGDAVRQEIARGASAAIPAVPFTRYGGVLTGWNTVADGSGTAYAPGETVTPTADMTLYAQWRADAQALDPYDLLSIDELPNVGRLHAGHTYRLTASYPELGLPADVTWRSLDPSVLTVDERGNVTAVSNGWACVMATDETGKASQVELTVFLNDPAVRIAGDVDMDGAVGVADVVLITRSIAGGWNVRIWEEQADVNADGIIDLKDAILIRRYLAGGWGVTLA